MDCICGPKPRVARQHQSTSKVAHVLVCTHKQNVIVVEVISNLLVINRRVLVLTDYFYQCDRRHDDLNIPLLSSLQNGATH